MFVELNPKGAIIGAKFYVRADLIVSVDVPNKGDGAVVAYACGQAVAQALVADAPREVVEKVAAVLGRPALASGGIVTSGKTAGLSSSAPAGK